MSDDFGTVNLRHGDRGRELEVLRRHYRQHREALERMTADAPTEHLATEYQRLITEIDRALGKLDELDNLATSPAFVPPPPAPPQPHRTPPVDPALRSRTEPGLRPLATNPAAEHFDDGAASVDGAGPRSRVALILVVAAVALGLIGWLIWRASSDRTPERPVVTEAVPSTIATQSDVAPAEPVASAELSATPASHDYGTIRKGTRATRQFELANNTDEPMTIQVARSTCRCLYYEHAPIVPPKAKEMLTVTIDGARAKSGALHEQVKVSSKSDPSVGTSIDVIATVR